MIHVLYVLAFGAEASPDLLASVVAPDDPGLVPMLDLERIGYMALHKINVIRFLEETRVISFFRWMTVLQQDGLRYQ